MTETEKQIKEKLLQSLIDMMDNTGSERLAPKKNVAVEVAAPDKDKLLEGIEKAKDLLQAKDMPENSSDDEDSDEDRLRALLADAGEDDEDEDSKPSIFSRK